MILLLFLLQVLLHKKHFLNYCSKIISILCKNVPCCERLFCQQNRIDKELLMIGPENTELSLFRLINGQNKEPFPESFLR